MVSRKISLFGKMQRGRSPSFELFQLDMYAIETVIEASWEFASFTVSIEITANQSKPWLYIKNLYNGIF